VNPGTLGLPVLDWVLIDLGYADVANAVMAITKMSIWVRAVNLFTGTATPLRQCGCTSDWMVHAGLNGESHEQDYPENSAGPRRTAG
jgi:hypothetical protein